MSDDKPKDPPKPRHGEAKESGRVAFDARGNPVWEWKESTGVFERNISTQRLKKLEAQDLKLEETLPVGTKDKDLAVQDEALPGGGINPYDTGGLKTSRVTTTTHPALVHKQQAERPTSSSLASKYANAARKKADDKPQSAWQKLKSKLKGK